MSGNTYTFTDTDLTGGGLIGGTQGNDTYNLTATNTRSQLHPAGGEGSDTFNLIFQGINSPNLNNGNPGPAHGHHVYGHVSPSTSDPAQNDGFEDGDTFNFQNVSQVSNGGIVVGRIDDYDPRDQILIEGVPLDLSNPGGFTHPNVASVRIVTYQGAHNDKVEDQAWLLIQTSNGGTIFYALEAARVDMDGNGGSQGRQESHFLNNSDLPNDFNALPDYDIVNLVNFVPEGFSADPNGVVYNDRDIDAADVNEWIDLSSGGATNHKDLIAGGVNDDKIAAGAGHDHVWGGSGDDLIYGNDGNDKLQGNTGDDRLYGQGGVDEIRGGLGDDYVDGGGQSDWLYGGAGDDEIHGGWGNDVMDGGKDDDSLFGGNANDTVRGGGGDDEITGGKGRDDLWGDYNSPIGSYGADVFVFKLDHMVNLANNGWDETALDKIHDFHEGIDKIQFSGLGTPQTTQDLRDMFMAWEPGPQGSTYGADTHFTLLHKATNKALLVNVQDGLTWNAFMDIDNFIFV